jgi:hypothetical protein
MGLLGKSGFRPFKIKLEFLNLDFIKEEIFLCTLIFFSGSDYDPPKITSSRIIY